MVIGPVAMPPARATVMLGTDVPVVVVARAEASAVAAPVAFPDCAGAVEDDAPAAAEEAGEGDAALSEDGDGADVDSAEADKDGLAEQPTTARAARTAHAGATLTLNRRVTPSPGAHGYRADVGQRRSRYDGRSRSPSSQRLLHYGFLAIPQ
jgi:hypothetical protein